MTSPTLEAEPKPKRRWFQFSLRTLLIGITLCSLPMAWVGQRYRQAQGEKEVIAWVTKMRGEVVIGAGWTDRWIAESVIEVHLGQDGQYTLDEMGDYFNPDEPRLSDLSPLAKLHYLEGLFIGEEPVKNLFPLAQLKHLKHLSLSDTYVSDLSPLAELYSLEDLDLSYSKVSDLSPYLG